jgi:hypothetical protein
VNNLTKYIGKLKAFNIISTWRECRQCKEKVESLPNAMVRCSNCGLMSYKKSKRVWTARATFDIFDTDIQALLTEKPIEQLIGQAGLSWREQMDRLKDMRGQAWYETYVKIKKEIECSVETHLIGKVTTFYGEPNDKNTFIVKKIGKSSETVQAPETGAKFVQGTTKELDAITEKALPTYSREEESWGEMHVLIFSKNVHGVKIEIGLRAPLREYSKSYRVWMRANGTHMYPATPVRTAKDQNEWVLRNYHTKGWTENLQKHLEYCKSLEEQLIKVVTAAQEMRINEVNDVIQELPADTQEEIKARWHEGTLWDLVAIAGKIDRSAAIAILKKFGLLTD